MQYLCCTFVYEGKSEYMSSENNAINYKNAS